MSPQKTLNKNHNLACLGDGNPGFIHAWLIKGRGACKLLSTWSHLLTPKKMVGHARPCNHKLGRGVMSRFRNGLGDSGYFSPFFAGIIQKHAKKPEKPGGTHQKTPFSGKVLSGTSFRQIPWHGSSCNLPEAEQMLATSGSLQPHLQRILVAPI